jgi:hypothetical protein
MAICTDPGCPRAGLCPLLPPQPGLQSLYAPLVPTARFVTHFFAVLLIGQRSFWMTFRDRVKKKYICSPKLSSTRYNLLHGKC